MTAAEQLQQGELALDSGQIDLAIELFRRVVQLAPDNVEAHGNLGIALKAAGRIDEAIAIYRQAIRLSPVRVELHYNLGVALQARQDHEQAAESYRQAIQLKPDLAPALNNLAGSLLELGRVQEAIASYRRAIQIQPDFPDPHYSLGVVLQREGKFDEAIAHYRRAIELRPTTGQWHNNLANALKSVGRVDEAIEQYKKAISLQPGLTDAHSNLILAMHYLPGVTAQEIRSEAVRWNARHAQAGKQFVRPHENDRDPSRRLRIGYVSPDFCDHVAGRVALPLIRGHNRAQVSVHCYSNVRRTDQVTREFVAAADHWRSIHRADDQEVAEQIRRDEIDILVDLALHTAGNRLTLFALKPAPVQVTYLAYPGPSGIEAMDYRLSDPHLDPVDADLQSYTERTIRLPHSYWHYQTPSPAPELSPPPSSLSGQITFGCLNNVAKISAPALDLWAGILTRVENSKLLILSASPEHRRRIASHFPNPGRIEYVERTPLETFFNTISRIDIALDSFPYAGGITTCDTLWMGVPIVTLSGATAVGRGGRSILSNIGLPDLIAPSPDEYVQIAAQLAANPAKLAELRAAMRERMRASPLMDSVQFVADIENAYRQMWRIWCATESTSG